MKTPSTKMISLRPLALGLFCLIQLFASKVEACSMSVTPVVTYTCTGNGKDGIVTLNISNGTAPYTVLFLGNSTISLSNQIVYSGLAATTASFTVTDANLCSVSVTASVARNTLPSAKVTSNKSLCAGTNTSVSLGATAVTNNTYSWKSSPSGFTSTASNPSVSPTQTTTYFLTETNANGCSKSNQVTITILPIPSVSLSASNNAICVDGNLIALQGRPSGGIYSGDGIKDSSFSPTLAGIGDHTITYSYSDGNGCFNTASTIITVLKNPGVSVTSPVSGICFDGGTIPLTGTPAGGIFSGDGLSDSTFDPTIAGLGSHAITYFYTNGAGCSFSSQVSITVNPVPNAYLNPLTVCLNNGKIKIQGNPHGQGSTSVYSGDGISGDVFDPAAAGVGGHTINFAYSDSNGCTASASATFTVKDIPTVSFSALAPVCANASAFALSGGSPTGGTFSGNGVSGGNFDPSVTGASTQTITYTYVSPITGCSNTATQSMVVNALPTLSFASQAMCISSGSVSLNASPSGGTYSGDGVSGSTFDPNAAGAGAHTISYSYTDQNGCSNSISATYTVYSLPVISMNTYTPVCINGGSITLAATPAGGTFSGNGVSNGIFDPVKAGVGTTTITYAYTNSNGCSNSATTTITVNAVPTVSISSHAAVCINAGSYSLSASPAGGVFSGDGVSGNTFNPVSAGVGSHTVTYNYTDNNGCSASASTTMVVNALPSVSISTYSPVCINASSFSLSASPSGGTFSGTGISGSTFSPAISGAGTFAITYTYADGNGCSASASTNITVNPLPVVSMSAVSTTCTGCGKVTLTGSPSGGTFSGTGVSGSTFDPSISGTGTFTITYSYSDGNGCSASATASITVSNAVTVSIASYSPVCVNASSFTLSGSPSGGTFSGNGVSGSTFSPSNAGVGNQTIAYTYGTGSATTVITVNALPTVTLSSHAAICINASAFALSGSPSGGTYSGDGVSSGTFTPSAAGAGSHVITYSYTNASGCTASATTTIVVNALPTVSLASHASVCANASSFSLSGSPAGGTYSGDGVSGSTFNPATASVGSHTITYTYSDANSCASSASITIVVNAVPKVTVGNYSAVCSNGSAVSLSGSPSGGTFSGDGVSGNYFNPASTTSGSHTILYTYTSGGCSGSASTTIVVNAAPSVSLASHAAVCINSGSFALSGLPSGGTYSGDGVSNGIFSPSSAGAGSHTISYSYKSGSNGCISIATITLVVTALPTATITASGSTSFCEGGSVKLTASSGGSYSWSNSKGPILGATGQTLTVTSAGTYYITITTNGCSQTSNGTIITVNPTPDADADIKLNKHNHGWDACPKLSGSANISGCTFLWSTGATTKDITVCPDETTTYWFTASKNGCTSDKDYVTVEVRDVQCHENHDKDKDKKVHMCHYDKKKGWGKICVNKNDVNDHLEDGDKFDDCNDFGSTGNSTIAANQVNVFPNPFTSSTTVSLYFASEGQAKAELWSLDGRLISTIYSGDVSPDMTYDSKIDGTTMMPGIYIIKVVSGGSIDYRKINLVR